MSENESIVHHAPIIDSALNLTEALSGSDISPNIRETLSLINVQYISFDGMLHQGQLVVHKNIAEEVQGIFKEMCVLRFPIEHAIPICRFGCDDETSMRANNTSAFNYRVIHGTNEPSNHSQGLAIDVNPLLNPCIAIDETLQPATSSYDPAKPGTLTPHSPVVELFTSRGWRWLGYRERKDWQHFDISIFSSKL